MKAAAKMADAYLNAVQNASGSNSLVNGISDDSDVPTNNIKKPRKSKATVADEEPVETVRKELKDRHPEISTADLRKVIAEQWAKMTAEEKEPYTKQASDAKQTYSDAKAAYDARSPDEVAAANAAVADAAASKKPRQSKPKADKPEQKPVSIKKACPVPSIRV
ncbi:hypothetical protein D9758_007510 [Tetrapyrgos nigripes]|uniref:HMG box domain-containing protein n=1 Tax=Tetrapyrgos nigripes TaxID=182062 RepID=A0A8H5G3S6_9AGAR|nr:hypothetical protein D9758_007510 [Tetrapyrgos nigripes]